MKGRNVRAQCDGDGSCERLCGRRWRYYQEKAMECLENTNENTAAAADPYTYTQNLYLTSYLTKTP